MPLSSSEHAQLQALLQKASEPVDAESTSSEGGFSLVTGSMCGAMTDGAKRRACSPVKEDSQGSEKLSYAGYGVTAHVHTRELMPGHTPDLGAICAQAKAVSTWKDHLASKCFEC